MTQSRMLGQGALGRSGAVGLIKSSKVNSLAEIDPDILRSGRSYSLTIAKPNWSTKKMQHGVAIPSNDWQYDESCLTSSGPTFIFYKRKGEWGHMPFFLSLMIVAILFEAWSFSWIQSHPLPFQLFHEASRPVKTNR